MNLSQEIEAAKKRDPKAEKALFMRYASKVFLLCRRYAGNDTDAHDYLQECWLEVFGKLHHFDPEKGAFGAWLHRVCTNVILQLIRKSKKQVVLFFPDELPEPELEESELELISNTELLEALDQLPKGYRQVVNLIIFEKWSHKQVARQLGISESTSRSQFTRAKRFLKNVFQTKIRSRHERKLA